MYPTYVFYTAQRKNNLVPQRQEGMVMYVTLVLLVYCPRANLPNSPWAREGCMQGMYPIYAFYTAQRKNNLVPQGYEWMAKYVSQVLLLYCQEEGIPTSSWAREGYMYRIYPNYAFYMDQRKNNMVPLGQGGVVKHVIQVMLVDGTEKGIPTSPWAREGYMQRMYPTYTFYTA